jgi:hypothetical protein
MSNEGQFINNKYSNIYKINNNIMATKSTGAAKITFGSKKTGKSSKKFTSNKTSKNYKKPYKGQGR